MKKTIKHTILYSGVCMLLLLVLSACNSESTDKKSTTAQENSTSQEEASTKIHKDALDREVEIPTNPKRVIALWSVGEMLALDQKPIGATKFLLRFYTDDEKKDIEIIGDDAGGDLEKILALEPDLIMVHANATEEAIEKYSKIAPTVAKTFFGDPFESMEDLGAILNKEEEANTYIENYHQKVKDTQAQLGSLGIEDEKALVLLISEGNIVLFPTKTFPTIFDVYSFGLTDAQTEIEKEEPVTTKQLSLESFYEYADADRIFVIVNDEGSRHVLEGLEKDSVWNSLPAVEKGHVYELGNRISTQDVPTLTWALDEVKDLIQNNK